MRKILLIIFLGCSYFLSNAQWNTKSSYLFYKDGPNYVFNKGSSFLSSGNDPACGDVDAVPSEPVYFMSASIPASSLASITSSGYYITTVYESFTFVPMTIGSWPSNNYSYLAYPSIFDFDLGTCTASQIFTGGSDFSITVEDFNWENTSSIAQVCVNSGQIDLFNYLSVSNGVTLSGPGVTGGRYFNPSSAGVGSPVIIATKGYDNGSVSRNLTIVVRDIPPVSFAPIAAVCNDNTAYNLTSYVSGWSSFGGTFSGFGVSATNFIATNSGAVNQNKTISYVSGTNSFGCSVTLTGNIFVAADFSVNPGSSLSVCQNGSAITLNGGSTAPSPSNGSWSGTGVSGTNFDPGSLAPNTYTVTYTVNQGGCVRSATKSVTILPLPSVSAGSEISACDNNGLTDLNVSGVSPGGGTWSFPNNGIYNANINNATGKVNVNGIPAGTYTLRYSFTNGSGCTNTSDRNIVIKASPSVVAGANDVKCLNDIDYDLAGFSPAGGTWSGTGILTGTSKFSPATAGVGTWTITYSYTNSNGCTNSSTKTVTVNGVPAPFASNFSACVSSGAVALSGSPSGGTWTGNAVSSGNFNPSVAGVGTYNLTYTVTNASGCSKGVTIVATVTATPSISPISNVSVCAGAPSFALAGGNPAGGTYSGTAVNSGNFSPLLSGVGSFAITYTFTNGASCSGSTSFNVIVNPLPTVSAGQNFQACLNGGNVNLNDANVSPAGGTWSGLGVTGATFDPTTAGGAGNKTLTYTFVDGNGCSNSSNRTVTVPTTTAINAGANLTACVSSTSLPLTGESPTGGTWSGTAVTGNIFNPSAAGAGTFVITYSRPDASGCNSVSTRNIVVNPLPIVSAGGNQVACVSATSLTLTGSSPSSGGTWSGNTVVSGIFNPSLAGAGTYIVTYSFTDGNTCTNSATKNITVNPLPVVSGGANFTSCINGATVNLVGGTPAGGSWSGSGVTSNVFNPAAAGGAGNKVLTYSYTNGAGCTNTATITATVTALPTVSAGGDLGTCANVTALNLTGASPTGGTWSGVGVTGSIFNAVTAGSGTTVVTYSYTDAGGCSNSATRNINVVSSPTVTAGADESVCVNTAPFTLSGGTPAGGTWSGTSVLSNVFDPFSAGVGTYTVTYTFNNGAGCSGVATRNIQVKAIPSVTAGADFTACANGTAVTLSSGAPIGGTWSGSGVTGSTFNPTVAGVGTAVVTYSFVQSGCTGSATRQAQVFSLPVVSAGADLVTCVNNTSLSLGGASPAGGTWSGTAVSGNTFNATVAGIGTYVVTYSFTDGNGCTVQATRNVNVNALPTVVAGAAFSVCQNSPVVTLSGFSPAGGTWTGAGIAGNTFSPQIAGSGIASLTYTFSSGNGCSVSATRQVTVNTVPTVSAGVDLVICNNANVASIIGGSPSGGSWSGSGVVGSNYNPGLVSPGTYNITYSYTDANSCSSTASKNVTVNSVPVVSAGLDLVLCASDQVGLTGASPSGGSWTGNGVNGSNFNAASAGTGLHVITYSFTAANGCTNTATRNITVNALPTVSAGGDLTVCTNTPVFPITGASPANGIWSGSGVNNNNFTASLVGVGTFNVTYTFSNQTGCANTATKKITVSALPTVSGGADLVVCANAPGFAISGGTPSGGTWSGNGISNNTFNPLNVNVGSYVLTYTYSDLNGCASSATRNITVNALPTVTAGADLNRCLGTTFALTGANPSGGTWSGLGVSAGSFDTSVAGLGTQIVSYTFTSAQGCAVTSTRQVTVNALPVVSAGNDLVVCKGQTVTLADGIPSGGVWSGSGVTGNSFNSTFVAAGIVNLTYSYINAAGCSASAVKQVTVNSLPTVSAGSDVILCQNAGVVPLSGSSPSGGSWSGQGIVGTTFNTTSVGIGSYLATYTYTDGNGCGSTGSKNIVVNSVPSVSAGVDLNRCFGDIFTLSGGNPTGGAWNGYGVTGTSFDTNVAGLGTQVVTYSITGSNGCTNSATRNVNVNQSPVVSAGGDLTACSGQSITLTDGTPIGGTWSGSGISGNIFNASTAGLGTKVITYSYTNVVNGCTASDTRDVVVTASPTISAGADLSVCLNSGPVTLSGGTPSGGTWSGTNVAGGVFSPSSIGTYTLTYTVSNGCTGSATRQVTVSALPSVNAGVDLNKCSTDVFTLTGATPSGGTWSGTGVTNGSFSSADAGIGTSIVTYTVSNGTCSNSANRNIVVSALPAVSSGSDITTCFGTTVSLTDASPSGGSWSGNGVTGNSFNSALAGVGIQNLVYTYTSPTTGCINTATKKVAVNAQPTVTPGNDLTVCSNAGIVLLTGAAPTGGVWSGNGVTGGSFNPASTGAGANVVTYTYTDANGCSKAVSRTIIVNAVSLVSAGADLTVCSGAVVNLTGASPAGGTWSGNGVTGTTFDPSVTGPGTQIVTYSFTNASGCTTTAARNITVNSVPSVSGGTTLVLCQSSSPVAITGGSPTGGSWSGPGVSGTTFDPTSVTLGTYTITYSLNSNGCTGSATKTVNVVSNPTVTAGPDFATCTNAGIIALTGATPSGGVWSGSGISGSSFNPAVPGVGSTVLTYTYTQGAGCTGMSTRTVTVNSIPVVTAGGDLNRCIGDVFALTGANPSGGVWSGLGVTGNNFDASVAGVGTQVITYTFTSAQGCVVSATRNITVNALPTVTAGNAIAVCKNQSVALTDGSPSGGVWSGSGVSSNSFNAAFVAVGIYTLTYSFTNASGCVSTATKQVTVNGLPTVAAGADLSLCQNSAAITLSGANPAGGTWSGTNVSGTVFNTPAASVGAYVATYSVTDANSCTNTATRNIIVNGVSTVNAGSELTVCAGTVATLTGATPVGGVWSGNGITGNTFDSSITGVGTQVVTYTFTNASGCSSSATRNVVVNPVPVVSAGTALTLCLSSPATLLTGASPSGGTWSGSGVTGNNFDPASVGIGVYTLTYSYTLNGCSRSATRTVNVVTNPSVFAGPDFSTCLNAGLITLSGATPTGGVWSGTGISGNNFNPVTSGQGSFTLTYTLSQGAGCTGISTRTVTVNTLPTVSAGADLNKCRGEVFALTGASPSGGVWSGVGVTGTNFDTSVAGVGTQVVTYSYTSGQGCVVAATRNIIVNDLPTVSGGSAISVCKNQSVVLSDGSPSGGVWSGSGVSSNTFNANFVAVGIYTLTYSFTNASGCVSTATKQVTVNALPTVSAGVDLSLCQNTAAVNLSGANPSGGTWSGTNVSGTVFNTPAASVGVYVATYSITDANSCTNTATRNIIVNGVSTVNAGSELTVCAGTVATLTGATPVGGVWSGNGITGNTFDSSITGVGTQVATYTFTNASGCATSATRNIVVNAVPVVTAGTALTLCLSSPSTLLTGASPSGGTWSGSGVTGSNFDPAAVGTGNYNLTYSYTLSGCSASATKVVSVVTNPTVNAGIDLSTCLNSGIVSLATGASPVGGVWSGTAVVGTNFNPATAGVGSFTITYTYTQGAGCVGSDTRIINVNSLPTVSAGADLNRCLGDVFSLTGAAPSGGVWSGLGVSGTDFDSSIPGVGTHLVTYTYTSGQGCVVAATRNIIVNPLPTVTAGNAISVCKNQSLTLIDGLPSGGVWSGSGVSSNSFNANFVAVGIYTLTYSFTNASGCVATATKQVTVNALPIVAAGSDLALCQNSAAVTLSGANPAGGTWSGTNVSGTLFNTPAASVGAYVATYSITDANTCTNTATRNIIVNGVSTVNAGSDLAICAGTVATLTGATPVGGVWSGNGVIGNTFDSSITGVGTQVVNYTFTNASGCATSDTRSIIVNALPVVSAGTALTLCLSSPPTTLLGGTPLGGTWSGTGVTGNNFDPALVSLGNYTLTYTVTANGCSGTATKVVTVISNPTVNAGADLAICLNTLPISLSTTGVSPAGGVWSGSGVTGTNFNPATTGVGSYTLTYTYSQGAGCVGSATRIVTVLALPTVSAGPDLSKCLGEVFSLSGANPSGGLWSGLGAAGNTFDTSVAGVGTHLITYTYTSAQGCVVSATRSITVNALPVVSGGSALTICKNQSVALSDGAPGGGTWSGNGVSSNTFNASFVAAGIYPLTYTYTNANGCVGVASKQVTVNPLPNVSAGADLALCQNGPAVTLTGASPSGGTWSGTNVSGSVFNTSLASVGSYVLTYTYTDANSCTNTATRGAAVNAVTPVNAGSDLTVCNGTTVSLTGAIPVGGVWSGNGVNGTTFDSSVTGVGTQVVTYTYTNASGCVTSATRNVIVNAIPTVSAGTALTICKSSPAVLLTGGLPSGGAWSGIGVVGSNFDPSPLSIGAYTVTYSFTQNGCTGTSSKTVNVTGNPSVDAGLPLSTCTNAGIIALTGAAPAGGTWSGTGVTGTNFNPSAAGQGSFLLTYIYNQGNGCVGSGTRTVTVNAVPTVSAGADLTKCAGDIFTLTGSSPSGGFWSGTGVSSATFDTSVSGIGTQVVTYTYTSALGCSVSATRNIIVNALPTVSAGTNLTVCKNQTLTLTDGIPTGGTWSGAGITGNTFNTNFVAAGIYTITYSYTNGSGCSSTATKQVTVNALPTVTAGADASVCQNSPSLVLSGANPAGGIWSGTNVAGNVFNTLSAAVGGYVATYTFTDTNGCTNTNFKNITVNAVSSVSAGADFAVCQGSSSTTLTGASPSGGVWSGTGVSSNLFDPAVAGVGVQSLNYTFTNLAGCVSTSTRNVTVNALPTVQAGTTLNLCLSSPSTLLTGGTPVSGTWSGPGVSGSNFDPIAVGQGTYTVTYSYVQNGCTGSATKTVIVASNPTVNAGADLTTCIDNGVIALVSGVPSGGVWSGAGVSNNTFNPLTAGSGTALLTYTVTLAGGCSNSATRQITVKPKPVVNAGSNSQLCLNQTLTLSGTTPDGGSWSGTGVNGTVFTASSVGSQSLTYSYTDVNGCINSAIRTIEVLALPTVQAGSDQSTCINSGLLTLSDGNPSGGVWTGLGVSNGKLDPSITGTGTIPVVYTFVNGNGCSSSATKQVVVRGSPTVKAGDNQTFCTNGSSVVLTGATPAGGTWSGTGVSGSTFDPSVASPGNIQLTYTYTDANGCSASSQRGILINAAPVVSAGSAVEVCGSETALNLSGGNPLNGVWSGDFVNGSTFNAFKAGAGVYNVSYTVLSTNGCSTTVLKQITVNASPVVTVGGNIESCVGADPVELTGATPSGGVWTGSGVVGAEFRARNVASTGSNTLTYTYTSTKGCSSSASLIATVNALPSVSAGVSRSLCYDVDPVNLLDASPVGGRWSGLGIKSNTSLFDPKITGVGTFQVTYTLTDKSGCINTATKDMVVLGGLGQPTIVGNPIVCDGTQGVFTANVIGGNNFTTYKWYLDGDTEPFTDGRSISLSLTNDVTLFVDAINRQGCSSQDRGQLVVRHEKLTGAMTVTKVNPNTGDPITFEFVGSPAASYTWDFGDGGSALKNKVVHFYYVPGNYDVKVDLVSANACKATFFQKSFVRVLGKALDVITGAELNPDFQVSVYPVPFKDELRVAVNSKPGTIKIHVRSTIGVIVKTLVLGSSGKSESTIDTGDLSPGLYFIEVYAVDGNTISKIIKE